MIVPAFEGVCRAGSEGVVGQHRPARPAPALPPSKKKRAGARFQRPHGGRPAEIRAGGSARGRWEVIGARILLGYGKAETCGEVGERALVFGGVGEEAVVLAERGVDAGVPVAAAAVGGREDVALRPERARLDIICTQ
jgi:hypothetical protein